VARPGLAWAVRRIVLTGGPGAGKTTAVQRLGEAAEFADWRRELGGVTIVREAATSVYGRRKTRWDRLGLDERRDVQREIFRHQLEHEAIGEREATAAGHAVMLLDRGTIDGSAYWPDGPEAYWADVGSTPQAQAQRYDAVLLLRSSASIGAYDGDATNVVRFESPEAAMKSDEQLLSLWGVHSHLHDVPAMPDFGVKLAEVTRLIRACCVK